MKNYNKQDREETTDFDSLTLKKITLLLKYSLTQEIESQLESLIEDINKDIKNEKIIPSEPRKNLQPTEINNYLNKLVVKFFIDNYSDIGENMIDKFYDACNKASIKIKDGKKYYKDALKEIFGVTQVKTPDELNNITNFIKETISDFFENGYRNRFSYSELLKEKFLNCQFKNRNLAIDPDTNIENEELCYKIFLLEQRKVKSPPASGSKVTDPKLSSDRAKFRIL